MNDNKEIVVAEKDGLPGCPEMVWDGPYKYRCSLGIDVCSIHGKFDVYKT
jgi:hypothetical protein